MLYSRLIVALFLLVVSVDSGADALPMPSPNPRGDLGLISVASASPAYIHDWLTTPPSYGVTIKRLHVAKPEQLIATSFLVHGVTPDQTGNFSFNVSFYVLGPDGKPLFGGQDFAKGDGPIPINPSYIMADPALDIVLEDSDPPGVYTIVAQVVDLTSGKKAGASYEIKFIKN